MPLETSRVKMYDFRMPYLVSFCLGEKRKSLINSWHEAWPVEALEQGRWTREKDQVKLPKKPTRCLL